MVSPLLLLARCEARLRNAQGKRWGRGGMQEPEVRPHVSRGQHRNGNPPGDFTSAPRCGARTRRGTLCRTPAMPNGRCRLHGGLSTGPRTAAGIERIRLALTKHGRYSEAARADRQQFQALLRGARETLRRLGTSIRASLESAAVPQELPAKALGSAPR